MKKHRADRISTAHSRVSASRVAGLLRRNRPDPEAERQTSRDEDLLRRAKKREQNQEKTREVAKKVQEILQNALPDDSPRDQKTGLKFGELEVITPGPETKIVRFAHIPQDDKYSTAQSVIEIVRDGTTTNLELMGIGWYVDMTLSTTYGNGSVDRGRTLSDAEFERYDFKGYRPQWGDFEDLADLCLNHAERAQNLASELLQPAPEVA